MNPETIAGYRIHPAANLFPLMDAAELQALADDIKKNGQRDAIFYIFVAHQKRGREGVNGAPEPDKVLILDGRNRLLACEIAGEAPWFNQWPGASEDDPIAFVLSKNLHRRHLTAEQRAAIVLQAEELSGSLAKLQAEAQERKQANLAPKASREAIETRGKTAAVIADKAKVSRATVERVQAATKNDPEALDAIAKGTTTSAKVKAAAKHGRTVAEYLAERIDHHENAARLNAAIVAGLRKMKASDYPTIEAFKEGMARVLVEAVAGARLVEPAAEPEAAS
jgi:hypothetical protein